MNELKIFENPDCDELLQVERSLAGTYLGIVYALEFGDMLKIGHSIKPYCRMKQMKKTAEYSGVRTGRMCISVAHTNHLQIEAELHAYFAPARKEGTELFNLHLDDFCSAIRPGKFEFLDESERIEARGAAFIEFAKEFVSGKKEVSETTEQTPRISLDDLAEILETSYEAMLDIGASRWDAGMEVLSILGYYGLPVPGFVPKKEPGFIRLEDFFK